MRLEELDAAFDGLVRAAVACAVVAPGCFPGLGSRVVVPVDMPPTQAQTPEGLKALGWLLDVAIECAKHGVSDPATPFALLEEAMEATPIAHCEAVWGVLESRRDQLTLVSALGRGEGVARPNPT